MMPEQRAPERLIVYGGTFDPVHRGHLMMAEKVSRIFEAPQVLLVPARVPPHKQAVEISSAFHRFAMLALATASDPSFAVDPLELEDASRPYSYQTVERLRERYGGETQLFFLMGADMYEDLPNWREVEQFLSQTNVVVTARPGHERDSVSMPEHIRKRIVHVAPGEKPEVDARKKIYLTNCGEIAISSSAIRAMVKQRQSIAELVQPRVAAYIEKYGLYQS